MSVTAAALAGTEFDKYKFGGSKQDLRVPVAAHVRQIDTTGLSGTPVGVQKDADLTATVHAHPLLKNAQSIADAVRIADPNADGIPG